MATLSELARTQQTTSAPQAQSVATGSATPTSIQATQTVNKSAGLAKDIGKMFGGLMQEHQQASEYAGKRVGTDNLVEYKKEMGRIAEYYAGKENLTSADMVEKSRSEQGIYEHYMQRGHFGDNELANQAFKDTYARPATDNLFATKTQNESNRVKLFQHETKRDVTYAIEYLGDDINAEVIDSFKDMYRDAGLPQDDIDTLVVNAATDGLTTTFNENFSAYMDEAGNLNDIGIDNAIDKAYRHYLHSPNEMIRNAMSKQKKAVKSFMDTKSKEARNDYFNKALTLGKASTFTGAPYTGKDGTYYHFASTAEEFMGIIKKNFPLLTEVDNQKIELLYKQGQSELSNNPYYTMAERVWNNNKQGGSIDVADLSTQVSEISPALDAIISNPAYSDSFRSKATKMKENLIDMMFNYKTVSDAVDVSHQMNDYSDLSNLLQSPTTFKGPLGDTVVKKDFTKARTNQMIDKYDSYLDSVSLKGKDKKETTKLREAFSEELLKMYKLSKAGTKESAFLMKIGQEFNSEYINSAESVDDAWKMVLSARILSDDSNNAYGIALDRQKIMKLTDILGNPELDDEAKVALFNKTKYSFMLNKDKIINGSKSNTRETLDYFNSAYKDDRLELTMLNYIMANDTTGTYKEGMSKDEAYDLIMGNSITYRVRETGDADDTIFEKWSVGLAKETLKAGASFFADRFDGIVIPNRIGNYTDDKGAITNAVTGILRFHNLQLSEVRVEVTSKGNVLFYNKDSRELLSELNSENLETFSKHGAK